MGSAFVYLHGGPGFNSASARALLGPSLSERGHTCAFWDEPSPLRPHGDRFEPELAYGRWLASAERFTLAVAQERPVYLLVHSFTVHAGLELARRYPERIAGLVVIAPAADSFRVFCSVLGIAASDFDESGDKRGDAVRRGIQKTTRVMDEPMQEAFALAAADERLFEHYWVDGAAKARAAAVDGGRFTVDVESFLSVLCDYRDRHHELHSSAPVTQPVLALFGDGDIVTPRTEHLPALEAIAPHTEAITIPDTGHYLHLEAPVTVVELIEGWIARSRPPVDGVAHHGA